MACGLWPAGYGLDKISCFRPSPGAAHMLLDLTQLRTGNEHIERQAEPEALGIKDDGFRVLSPLVFVVDARKDSQKVRLVGSLKTMVECDCSRCLDPFPVPVDVSFDLIFLPASEN